jgi:AraC-like DNA-binding protein
MKLELMDFISLFTLFQLLFLTVVIVNYKKGKRLSNSLLAGFMASNALLIAELLLRRLGWISSVRWVGIYGIGNSMYFLLMPFLYLYIRSLCYENFHLKIAHLLHLTPFIVFVMFSFLNYFVNHTSIQVALPLTLRQSIAGSEYWLHQAALHVQILSYLVASWIVLAGYRKRLKDMYSSIERIDLQWCNLLLAGFATMWFLDLSNWILKISNLSSPDVSRFTFTASLFINLAFTLVVTYKGLAQSVSFSGIQGLPKYAASRLTATDCDDISRRLTGLMETDKLYLSPSISLDDISEKLNIPARNLSQAIHVHFNQNFFDFINSYRIEEIKKRLRDERNRNFTLVAIAYDAGFNSKSVFNAAFKKRTGMTPKEYRRQL